jgi:CDP-diacylglycerol---serine O-phosphatidyltransferase
MTWRHVIPVSFTLGALLAGFCSMLMSAAGEYVQSAQLIMLSMILDGLDGAVARLLKGTTKLGAELDTFVDFSSFGVAPAILAYQAALKDFGVWGVLIVSAMVLSGALRLSRFRIVDPFRGGRGYLGLPITVNGGWVTLFVFATQVGLGDVEWFNLHRGPMAAFVWASTLVFVALQISHVHYHKPTKDPVFLVLSVLVVACLFARMRLGVAAALTMCAYGFIYGFITPFFHKGAMEDEEEEPLSISH